MIITSTTRAEFVAASELMSHFGDHAVSEAVARANHSRDRGNVIRFCTWRQVERLIRLLSTHNVSGTIH